MALANHVRVCVVGAGVVGLAVARACAVRGAEVVVVEAADAIGTGTSSRSSEVIHAGIHFPSTFHRAQLCVAGKNMLYQFCAERGVPHRRCGKLLVATNPAEKERALQVKAGGERNGVRDLVWLEAEDVAGLEPEVRCVGAVLSPSTGIVDSHTLMLALQGEAEDHGSMIAFNTKVTSLVPNGSAWDVVCNNEPTPTLSCTHVINCAGLYSADLARSALLAAAAKGGGVQGELDAVIPRMRYGKGTYFKWNRARQPFTHLVYPVPVDGGLGVHVTFDLGGQVRFGPDCEWVESPTDLAVHPHKLREFEEGIRRYFPALGENELEPDYCGMRPKLTDPGQPAADFKIEETLPGLINLVGIESPGLTSCLAIGDLVANLARL